MQQLIIHGSTIEDRLAYVEESFPGSNYQTQLLDGVESSLKIESIRKLTTSLATSASHARLVIIKEAQALTAPAQQALLKTLEEPPLGVTIILSLPNPSLLLPTIISRCQLVRITPTSLPGDNQDLALIKRALSATPGTRLQLASTLGKDRLTNTTWLEQAISALHQVMQGSNNPRALTLLTQISQSAHLALTRIKSNCNVTLTLESLFITLPKVA